MSKPAEKQAVELNSLAQLNLASNALVAAEERPNPDLNPLRATTSIFVFLVGGLAGSGKTSHLRPLIKHFTEALAFSVKYLDKDSIGKTMPGATSPEIYEAMMTTAMRAKEDVIVHEGNILGNLSLFRDYIRSQHALGVKVICLDFQCGGAKLHHARLVKRAAVDPDAKLRDLKKLDFDYYTTTDRPGEIAKRDKQIASNQDLIDSGALDLRIVETSSASISENVDLIVKHYNIGRSHIVCTDVKERSEMTASSSTSGSPAVSYAPDVSQNQFKLMLKAKIRFVFQTDLKSTLPSGGMSNRFFNILFEYLDLNSNSYKEDTADISAMTPKTFPRLPREVIASHISEVQKGVDLRVRKYLPVSFTYWSFGAPESENFEEYNRLNLWRKELWYDCVYSPTLQSRPDFMISQELLRNGNYRKDHLIAFSYNNTDPSYNCSTIRINGHTYLALEAPSASTIKTFRKLLHNYNVGTLVCLTPAFEGDVEKCHDYWTNNLGPNNTLRIPLESERPDDPPYTVKFVQSSEWVDNSAGDPEQTLDLVLKLKNSYDPSSIVAVHCHSGVSRTGFYIAANELLVDIDRQVFRGEKPKMVVHPKRAKISPEKTVMQLSMQRFSMVGQAAQYHTLHKLIDFYVKRLGNLETSPALGLPKPLGFSQGIKQISMKNAAPATTVTARPATGKEEGKRGKVPGKQE